MAQYQPDPKLDLVLERVVDVPVELIWKAWTEPRHIKQWFTPAPWKTVESHIDLRPGGAFGTVMESPEGQKFPSVGCFLEIVENEKLVWTSALGPDYRPTKEEGPFLFTAMLLLEKQGTKTKYTAIAIHRDEQGRKQHEEMGFHMGWGAALDQLVAYSKMMS